MSCHVQIIFVMHLYNILQQEISLYWLANFGTTTLGIKVIFIALICLKNLSFSKNSRMASVIFFPTIFQDDVKNPLPYPSGPVLLLQSILNIVSLTFICLNLCCTSSCYSIERIWPLLKKAEQSASFVESSYPNSS